MHIMLFTQNNAKVPYTHCIREASQQMHVSVLALSRKRILRTWQKVRQEEESMYIHILCKLLDQKWILMHNLQCCLYSPSS